MVALLVDDSRAPLVTVTYPEGMSLDDVRLLFERYATLSRKHPRIGYLIDLLAAMLARREQWRPIADLDDPQAAIGAALDELLAEELAQVESLLDAEWQAPWMPLARFAAAQLGDGVQKLLGFAVADIPPLRCVILPIQ